MHPFVRAAVRKRARFNASAHQSPPRPNDFRTREEWVRAIERYNEAILAQIDEMKREAKANQELESVVKDDIKREKDKLGQLEAQLARAREALARAEDPVVMMLAAIDEQRRRIAELEAELAELKQPRLDLNAAIRELERRLVSEADMRTMEQSDLSVKYIQNIPPW